MPVDYEIVKYAPEFRAEVAALQRPLWGSNARLNEAYLRWKYHENPASDSTAILLALFRGKVVGMRGVWGARWQVGRPPQIVSAPLACDITIAPAHRNRGLFARLNLAALEELRSTGASYFLNLSAGTITQFGLLALGWRSTGWMEKMEWRSDKRTFSSRLIPYAKKIPILRSAFHLLEWQVSRLSRRPVPLKRNNVFDALDANSAAPDSTLRRHLSVENRPRPAAMAELVERIGWDGRMRRLRNRDYFDWRFRNPRFLYRFLFWEDSGLQGYLVLRASVYPNPEIAIVDWEAANAEARSELLRAALRLGKFQSLDIWSSTLSEEARAILENLGFRPPPSVTGISEYRPTVLVKPMGDNPWTVAGRNLLDLSNWDLRLSDSDAY